MKYFIAILFVILVLPAFSQEDSSAVVEQKTTIGSIREKLKELRGIESADSLKGTTATEDSLRLKAGQALDSLNLKINGRLGDVTEKIPTGIALDTLPGAAWGENLIRKADSIQHAPDAALSALEEKLNKPKNTITQRVDSLAALLDKPAQAVNEKIDSVLNSVNARIDSLERKVMSTVEKTESKIQDKVNAITEGRMDVPGLDKSKIPEIDIDDAGISTQNLTDELGLEEDLDIEIPELDTESLDLKIPEIESLDVNKSVDLPDVTEIKEISDVKQGDEVSKISGELDDVDRQLAELEKYESELRKAKEANLAGLEKRTEEELMKIDEVSGVAGEAQKVAAEQAKYQAMVQKYSDKKLLEEENKTQGEKRRY